MCVSQGLVQVTRVEIEDDVNEEKTVKNAIEWQTVCVFVCMYVCMYVCITHTCYVLNKPPMPYIASSPLCLLRGFASCLNFGS